MTPTNVVQDRTYSVGWCVRPSHLPLTLNESLSTRGAGPRPEEARQQQRSSRHEIVMAPVDVDAPVDVARACEHDRGGLERRETEEAP